MAVSPNYPSTQLWSNRIHARSDFRVRAFPGRVGGFRVSVRWPFWLKAWPPRRDFEPARPHPFARRATFDRLRCRSGGCPATLRVGASATSASSSPPPSSCEGGLLPLAADSLWRRRASHHHGRKVMVIPSSPAPSSPLSGGRVGRVRVRAIKSCKTKHFL